MTDYKDTTNRHLRHKLQSLARRIDELEEASSKLQKSEDELLDLQDKIIQAEGANSTLLGEVDALRRRVLKIEGKDEEVRKAEDLCRLVREKLVEEEELTKELKSDIERLQGRMAELEKLEEAFGKSKSDCTQLCLSLNEEKNLTRKLSSELEGLKARMKEVDASESRLDRAEQALAAEMERLKALTQAFVGERKWLLEKQREDDKLIRELTEKLERNNQLNAADQSRNTANLQTGDLRIEDDLPPGLTAKLGRRKKSLEFLDEVVGDLRIGKSEKEKKGSRDGQKEEEDNKVKDLTQEVERLKNRLKQLELVEEDLKKSDSKNGDLLERFQQEKSHSRALSDQIEQLKTQLGIGGGGGGGGGKILENGKAENEEINVRGGFRQEKPKFRSGAAEPAVPKHKARELSPTHQRKEAKLRTKELSQSEENSPKTPRRALSPAHKSRRGVKTGMDAKERGKGALEEKMVTNTSAGDGKKPSVLSRYPPAANDQKPWKASAALTTSASLKPGEKSRVEKLSQLCAGSDSESNGSDVPAENPGKAGGELAGASPPETDQEIQDPLAAKGHLTKANGSFAAYKSHVSPHLTSADPGSEGHSSASETESTGSRRSAGEAEPLASQEGTGSSARPATAASAKHSRYARLHDSHSEGSSARSSFDEERPLAVTEGGSSSEATPTHTPLGIEIRRACSPREALRSKAVIKPAIVEIDRKEVMSSGGAPEPLAANGKPRISTKPAMLTSAPGKMTSSITIYPNDPGSSRTSSRSSSVSSEPPSSLSRERHTSTSNIVITPGDHHRGSVSIPYEISIPRAEITLRPPQEDENSEEGDTSVSMETSRVETQLVSRSSLTLRSPPENATTPNLNNDTESVFESSSSSSSSSTTTATSWRRHQNQPSSSSSSTRDDCLPDMRNVTVRSNWRNRGGAASVDEVGLGRSKVADCSEDEATWRAYRATTVLDAEEPVTTTTVTATRTGKPSPAEVYMQRINSAASAKEVPEPARRSRSTLSPSEGYHRSIPHEPVVAQELQPWNRPQPPALEETPETPQGSWRQQLLTDLGSLLTRTEAASRRTASRPELWAGPGGASGRGPAGRNEGRAGGSRPWSTRQTEN